MIVRKRNLNFDDDPHMLVMAITLSPVCRLIVHDHVSLQIPIVEDLDKLFVVDGRISKTWCFFPPSGVGSQWRKAYSFLGPKEWGDDARFFDELMDGSKEAYEFYNSYLSVLAKEHKQTSRRIT